MRSTTTRPTRRSRTVGFAAIAVVAGGLALSGSLAAADTEPEQPAPRASGIYALTREQLAYFDGFQVGRGYQTSSNEPWALSLTEIGALLGDNGGSAGSRSGG